MQKKVDSFLWRRELKKNSLDTNLLRENQTIGITV
jgi:hypothetical protein